MRVSEIADLVGGRIEGDPSRAIESVAKIEDAGPNDLGFISLPKYARYHDVTKAGALLVSTDLERTRQDLTYIVVENPQRAIRSLLQHFAPLADLPNPGVHPTAVIGAATTLADDVRIGAHVVIGDGCAIAAGVSIGHGTVIGRDVVLGTGTVLHANVTLYHGTIIGARCIVHSGAVIGSDGFGFEPQSDGTWQKVPHIGVVVLGDDVEIGAGTTIDRATMGRTEIGVGVKIDNLVHIAHNVVVGANTVVAAQVGIAGSTRLGERNLVAGQVGIVGHLDIVDDVIIEPQAGVSKSIRKAGRYFGHPAKEHSIALRQEGAIRQLPDLLAEIREINDRLTRLEAIDGVSG